MNEIAEKIQKESDKDFGKGIMTDATHLLEQKLAIVSVSPALDIGLGGGIPEGSWVTISGNDKCGKSSAALQIAANAQSIGKFVYFYAPEGRIKKRDLEGIHNLDTSKNFKLIQSIEGHILSAEEYLTHIIKVIKSHPKCVVIIDSLSSICSAQELTTEISSQTRLPTPKLLASFCRQLGGIVPVQNTILIAIQQLMANTSGYGSPYIEGDGRKIKYQVDVRLRCKSHQGWTNKDGVQIGQLVNWEIKATPLGPPNVKVKSYLRYGYGLDSEKEIFNLGVDFGLINKSGAWYTFDCIEEPASMKYQGEEKCVQFLRDNPEHTKTIYDMIKDMT